ncbi:hypothetical protein, partial [Chryseobacterium aurantiacum]|uniref:hypothetical protein n=1 Tax=Chryseobacterium aurantiacum TaxID=2116499 RepID=UPI001E65C357
FTSKKSLSIGLSTWFIVIYFLGLILVLIGFLVVCRLLTDDVHIKEIVVDWLVHLVHRDLFFRVNTCFNCFFLVVGLSTDNIHIKEIVVDWFVHLVHRDLFLGLILVLIVFFSLSVDYLQYIAISKKSLSIGLST